MSGISFFSDMVQSITDRGRRLLAAGARSEPVASRDEHRNALRHAAFKPRRGLRHGIGRRDPSALDAAGRDRPARLRAHVARAIRPRHRQAGQGHRALPNRQEFRRRHRIASGGRAAPPGTRAQAEPRAQRHGETGGDARAPAGHEKCDGTVSRRRCRLLPPVRFLVQPRLPDPSPDRLVDAGRHPGEDHQIRGGARDRRLGRTAAEAGSRRPQVLCVLPPAARRRSADLRRGCADQGNSLRHR